MNTGNYIQLSGRLTADVTPNEGKTFARFTLAKNFISSDKQAPPKRSIRRSRRSISATTSTSATTRVRHTPTTASTPTTSA